MRAKYKFEVDWDNDNTYGHAESDISSRVVNEQPWSWSVGRSGPASLIDKSWAGQLKIPVLNNDGLFSHFNVSGDLYGKLLAGRRVRVSMAEPTSSTFEVVWSGRVYSLVPMPSTGRVTLVMLSALGILRTLAQAQALVEGAAAIRTDEALGDLFDAMNPALPDAARDLSIGSVTMTHWNPASSRVNVLTEANAIADTEGGWIRESNLDEVVFENRSYRQSGDQAVPQALYSDDPTDIESDAIGYTAIPQKDPLESVYNVIRVEVPSQETAASQSKLWELADVPSLEADASLSFLAEYPAPGAASQAVGAEWGTPVIVANSNAQGTGTNLTSNISVVTENGLNEQLITLTNDGSQTAYLRQVQAWGKAITRADPQVIIKKDDDSIALYGERLHPAEPKYVPSIEEAENLAALYLAISKELEPQVTIRYRANRNIHHIRDAINRRLSNRVTVKATGKTELGIDSEEMFVEHIRHNVTQGGGRHDVTLTLSPTAGIGEAMIFGTGVFGTGTFGA